VEWSVRQLYFINPITIIIVKRLYDGIFSVGTSAYWRYTCGLELKSHVGIFYPAWLFLFI
jgi:hypothetical protein